MNLCVKFQIDLHFSQIFCIFCTSLWNSISSENFMIIHPVVLHPPPPPHLLVTMDHRQITNRPINSGSTIRRKIITFSYSSDTFILEIINYNRGEYSSNMKQQSSRAWHLLWSVKSGPRRRGRSIKGSSWQFHSYPENKNCIRKNLFENNTHVSNMAKQYIKQGLWAKAA